MTPAAPKGKARKKASKKKRARKPKLNGRQRAFVREYLKDSNATQAAIRAKYSKKTAHSAGPRLLENVGVAAAIAAGQEKAAQTAEFTAADVMKRYRWLATADTTQAFEFKGKSMVVKDLSKLPEDLRYAIASIAQTKDGVKLTFHSKADALAKMGKHLGMFVDVHIIKGEMDAIFQKLQDRLTPEEYARALEAIDAPDS